MMLPAPSKIGPFVPDAPSCERPFWIPIDNCWRVLVGEVLLNMGSSRVPTSGQILILAPPVES